MSDVMLQAAVKLATEQAASPASSAPIADANSMDVSRFRDAMSGGETADQGLDAGLQQPPVSDLQKSDLSARLPTETSNTLGDSILDGLGKMRSEQDANVQQINQLVGEAKDGPLTVQDTMELQFRLMQLSLHQDLTAKVADKSSQGVQNLMKNQ